MASRVLVQLNSLELGGSQLNGVDLAAAVREHGYEPVLVGPRDSMPDTGDTLLDVARARELTVIPIDRPITTRQGARELSQIANSYNVDLVHTYGSWSIRPAYWGPCRLGRRPLVLTVYEMEVHSSVYRAPRLIVGTKYLEEELVDRRGQVTLISPPVDLDRDDPAKVAVGPFLESFGLDPTHRRVVIVSRLDAVCRPIKSTGIEQAIEAIGRLEEPDVDLVIVGSGNAEDRLRELGAAVNQRLGRTAVVFTGGMADPRPAYACADVVIGMGGSAARGLAFGAPLIVTGEFGWFETFKPDTARGLFRNSFWTEERLPDPVSTLTDQLRPLLADESQRRELGRFGREFAREHFGLKAMGQRLANVYDDALRSDGPSTWLHDLRIERDWARAWVSRHVGRRTIRPSDVDDELAAPRVVQLGS